jgi:predicted ferric reductase
MWPLWSLAVAGLYVLTNVFWATFWVVKSKPADYLEATARAVGHLVSVSMLLCVLPATRNSLLVWLLGESFERTLLFHRWMGRWTMLVLVAHTLLFSASRKASLLWDGTHVVAAQLYGVVGLVFCAFVILTSIERFRRRTFTFFYISHFTFLLFFLFAALHNAKFLPFLWASLVVWGIDRIFRLVWGTVPYKATEVTALSGGEVLRIRWPRHPLTHYEEGQYVFLNFPQISLLEWHPFTLTNGPREKFLEVNIKTLGKHTDEMHQQIPSKKPLWVRADGPYGHMMLPIKNYPVLLLIGAGVGVTPMISILRELYGVCGSGEHLPPKYGRVQSVFFHWGVRNMQQYGWFSPIIEEVKARSNYTHVPNFQLAVHSDQDVGEQGPEITVGRPNIAAIFRHVADSHPGSAVAVCVCGPPPVVFATWDQCSQARLKGLHFDLHFETFIF